MRNTPSKQLLQRLLQMHHINSCTLLRPTANSLPYQSLPACPHQNDDRNSNLLPQSLFSRGTSPVSPRLHSWPSGLSVHCSVQQQPAANSSLAIIPARVPACPHQNARDPSLLHSVANFLLWHQLVAAGHCRLHMRNPPRFNHNGSQTFFRCTP